MPSLLVLRFLVLYFYSLAVQAQSTFSVASATSSSPTTSSTSINQPPYVNSGPFVPVESFFIPTVKNNIQNLEKDLYVWNNSLVIFSIHSNRDYPSYYNGDMYDIDSYPIASLSLCIQSCVDDTIFYENDKGPICQGVAYINGLCWRKNGVSEASNSYLNTQAVSAIMHQLKIASIY